MTRIEAALGLRVRDEATGRTGVIVSVGCAHLGIVSVALDPRGYDASTVWIELESLRRIEPRSMLRGSR